MAGKDCFPLYPRCLTLCLAHKWFLREWMKSLFIFSHDHPKYSSNVGRILCPSTPVSHTPSVHVFPTWSTSNKTYKTSDIQNRCITRALTSLKKNFFFLHKMRQSTVGMKFPPCWIYSIAWFVKKVPLVNFPRRGLFCKSWCNLANCHSFPGRNRLVPCPVQTLCLGMSIPHEAQEQGQAIKGAPCHIGQGSGQNKELNENIKCL